jgi:hypothetical protein
MNLTDLSPGDHLSRPATDILAASAATAATIGAAALNDWLQSAVLILTLVFLALGIFLRFKKIKLDDGD